MARYVSAAYRLDAMYSSPLLRAQKTAEPLAALAGLPILVRDDLRELYFGAADGLTVPELVARFPTDWERAQHEEDLEFRFPGGEARVHFHDRVRRAFSALIQSHPDQTIAVVSHGGVLSSFLADVVEGLPQRWRGYFCDNCALSELLADGGNVSVVRRSVVEYL